MWLANPNPSHNKGNNHKTNIQQQANIKPHTQSPNNPHSKVTQIQQTIRNHTQIPMPKSIQNPLVQRVSGIPGNGMTKRG